MIEQIRQEALNKQLSQITELLKNSFNKGFEGCYYGRYIPKDLGDLLNENNISFSTYICGDFEESKVWYRKEKVTQEYKSD